MCRTCRLGHSGIEDVLDILGDLKQLPPALVKSIPDNFRAMLSALEVEFGLEISKEYVYDQCPDCCELYRGIFAAPENNICPCCASPRYTTLPSGKRQPRAKVSSQCVLFKAQALASSCTSSLRICTCSCAVLASLLISKTP
jgi:hypothetical protein